MGSASLKLNNNLHHKLENISFDTWINIHMFCCSQ